MIFIRKRVLNIERLRSFSDSRRAGLGAAFILEIEATIARIKETPDRWPVLE
jgi:hypothetical protein